MSEWAKFTGKDIRGIKAAAALRAADQNSYFCNLEFRGDPDSRGYEAHFTLCGICALMERLGLYNLTLYHEQGRRCRSLCAAVHHGIRWAILRLRL